MKREFSRFFFTKSGFVFALLVLLLDPLLAARTPGRLAQVGELQDLPLDGHARLRWERGCGGKTRGDLWGEGRGRPVGPGG